MIHHCSICGKDSDGKFCAFCGRPFDTASSSKIWSVRDLLTALTTMSGTLILLFAPLIKVPLVGSYSYVGALLDSLSNSYLFAYLDLTSSEMAALVLIWGIALAFLATLVLSIVGMFIKIDLVTSIFRWISLGFGCLLLAALLYLRNAVMQSALAGLYMPVRFGMVIGLLLLAAAVALSFARNLFPAVLYRLSSPQRQSGGYREPISSARSQPHGVLIGVRGAYAGARFDLNGVPSLMIGRDPSVCQIIFPKESTGISRRHCMVRFSLGENCYYLTDWSRNGTYLPGGVRLPSGRPHRVARGTTICFDVGGENAFLLE